MPFDSSMNQYYNFLSDELKFFQVSALSVFPAFVLSIVFIILTISNLYDALTKFKSNN